MHNYRQMSSNPNPLLNPILEYQLGDVIRATRTSQGSTCKVQDHIGRNN